MVENSHRELQRLMQTRAWPQALQLIESTLAATPGEGQWLVHRAQCLLALRRWREARAAAAVAFEAATGNATLLEAVGTVWSFLGEQALALQAYSLAVDAQPGNAQILFNRATVHRFLGQLAEAEADYDRVIELQPGDFEAYKNRSDLRKQTAERNHVDELQRLVARGFEHWPAAVQIHHALAKEYEDLGEYAKSFQHLTRGASERRRHIRYDVAIDVATVDWIIEAFPQAVPAREGAASDAPIFIVGLPRSGTTLVERILGSHSRVTSAGELNDMALCIVEAVRRKTERVNLTRRELVMQSASIDFAALGRDYLERAHAALGWSGAAAGRVFADKMPLNYLYCGLIHRALPHAKIIHLTRHPMAACYAMYKTLFKDAYPFSYDLHEIGRYYIAYRRLMEHWRVALPGVIHELSYEALVKDQLGESHRLLEFCELPWEEACADFHRNPAASTTASAAQVRQPIYESSVQQWRHYAVQLQPLRALLSAAQIDVS